MMTLQRFVLISLVLLLVSFLSGCYKEDRYQFPSGTFEYIGEEVKFYNDLYIDVLTISLIEISEQTFQDSNNINVIKNSYNSTYFSIEFLFKYSIESKTKSYSIQFIERVGDRSDTYKIVLSIDNEDVGISGDITLFMSFLGALGEDVVSGNTAQRITLSVKEYTINDIEKDEGYDSFPNRLYLVKDE